MTVTGRQFEISAGEHWAVITEVGANLGGYRVGAVEVTPVYRPDAIAPKSCGAVLMPWPNRIASGRYIFDDAAQQLALSDPALGNASHGLAGWVRWTPVRHDADAVTLECDVVPQKGWPFELHVRVTYRLDATQGLSVELHAENRGVLRLPFGAGCHPYLALGGTPLAEVQLMVPATQRLTTDERQIPSGVADVDATEYDLRVLRPLGELRLDTAYRGLIADADGRGRAQVVLAHGRRTLWWDPAFTTVQVFTPEKLVDQPAIAMEPMTCPADAFNSGTDLLILNPGQSWTAEWGIKVD
jgi:aldose 1-epimerase